jgi:hypothetical protein
MRATVGFSPRSASALAASATRSRNAAARASKTAVVRRRETSPVWEEKLAHSSPMNCPLGRVKDYSLSYQ